MPLCCTLARHGTPLQLVEQCPDSAQVEGAAGCLRLRCSSPGRPGRGEAAACGRLVAFHPCARQCRKLPVNFACERGVFQVVQALLDHSDGLSGLLKRAGQPRLGSPARAAQLPASGQKGRLQLSCSCRNAHRECKWWIVKDGFLYILHVRLFIITAERSSAGGRRSLHCVACTRRRKDATTAFGVRYQPSPFS